MKDKSLVWFALFITLLVLAGIGIGLAPHDIAGLLEGILGLLCCVLGAFVSVVRTVLYWRAGQRVLAVLMAIFAICLLLLVLAAVSDVLSAVVDAG